VLLRKVNKEYREHSLESGDPLEPKSLGIYSTKAGKRYHLQFDPEGKLAQAVLLPRGLGEGQLVLAFRAESREEAAKMLIEELDSGAH
jgi:hypothetical protein